MRWRLVLALVLVAAAFACSGRTTTGANPADSDASTDDSSETGCVADPPISPSGECPALAGAPVGCGYSMIDGCCVFMCPRPNCVLGGTCSPTDVCTGGVAGCTSNCQCLNGTWQAPCPTDLPQTGSACAPFAAEAPLGTECGYPTSTKACGAATCYCENSVWSCEPACIIGDASTSPDTGASDAAPDTGPLDAGGG
jgi:hypothetical protein